MDLGFNFWMDMNLCEPLLMACVALPNFSQYSFVRLVNTQFLKCLDLVLGVAQGDPWHKCKFF